MRAQVPVAGLNCSQLVQAWLASPPQMRKVSRVWADLATTILGSRHELEVDGWNTSADGSSPNPLPPVMRMAANGSLILQTSVKAAYHPPGTRPGPQGKAETENGSYWFII